MNKQAEKLIKTKGKADIAHEIAMGVKHLAEFTPESGTESLDVAIACFLRALTLEKEKKKRSSISNKASSSLGVARTYELLGDTYREKGLLKLAKEHYMEAMSAYETALNTSDVTNKMTKKTTQQMDDYQRVQDKEHRITCKLYQKDEKCKRMTLRRKYSDTIKLGQMNMNSGRYDEAKNRYNEALSMCKMRYGVVSVEVARVRELLGDLCVQNSDFEEAQGHYCSVLQALEKNKVETNDARYEKVVEKFVPIAGLH